MTPRACRHGEVARIISVLWLCLSVPSCRQDLRTRSIKTEHCVDQENGFMRPSLVFASQLRRERQKETSPASPQHTRSSQLTTWEGFFLPSCHALAAQPTAVGCSEEAFSSVSCPSSSPPKNQQPTRGRTLTHFPPHRPPLFPGCTLDLFVFPDGCRSPCVTRECVSQKERCHFSFVRVPAQQAAASQGQICVQAGCAQ